MKSVNSAVDKSVDKGVDSVRAVDRALDILLAFASRDNESDGFTAAQLLTRVDLSRPTLYRLLATLQGKGFVIASGDPQRFRLGPAVARLAHSWNASLDLAVLAEPAMRRVWQATGETVALFVPDGTMRVCVAEMVSQQPLSFKRGVGFRERLVLGASGRSILARIDGDIDLAAYADGVAIDLKRCRSELRAIRQRGYAVSRDEIIQGAVALAAPFFDGSRRVAGSLGVFGPTVRMPETRIQDIGAMLIEEAGRISAALGQPDA